jgi:hypothetical protein
LKVLNKAIGASPPFGHIPVKHHNFLGLVTNPNRFLLFISANPIFDDLATKIGLDKINSKKRLG